MIYDIFELSKRRKNIFSQKDKRYFLEIILSQRI